MEFHEIKTAEEVEWMRVHRNEPAQYKWFRQDRPISKEEQAKWWRDRDKTRIKYYMIENNGKRIGCMGFNPLNQYSGQAEFTIFILDEYRDKGYGAKALNMLLKHGFEDLHLSVIYSDCLQYPDEDRLGFYKKLGFVERINYKPVSYMKQGKRIQSIPFYMNRDIWEKKKGI